MPEYPEVYNVVQGLREEIVGKRIEGLSFGHGDFKKILKCDEDLLVDLQGRVIKNVKQRGKYIIFVFDEVFVISHLKMTGSWIAQEPKHNPPRKYHIGFHLGDRCLFYVDPRKFGDIYIKDSLKFLTPKLSPDPFDNTLVDIIPKVKKKANKTIKEVLLDQSIFCGVGNYLASEILWEVKIDPSTLCKDVDAWDWLQVLLASQDIIKKSIEAGGFSMKDFKHVDGGLGKMEMKVYGRKDGECFDCPGEKILKKEIGGRGTYFCPSCQK